MDESEGRLVHTFDSPSVGPHLDEFLDDGGSIDVVMPKLSKTSSSPARETPPRLVATPR